MVYVNQTVVNAQVQTILVTATYPCTLTGVRWSLSIRNNHAAADNLDWAIVIVKEGDAADAIATSDGASFYNPETNCLTYGCVAMEGTSNGSAVHVFNGTTKTMRKLQGGDQLLFVAKGLVNASKTALGCIQFFCKS